jgi:hypothetical protein
LSASNLAILQDRILLRQEKKQLYGTQLEYSEKDSAYVLSPEQDRKSLNSRRDSVGIGSIEEYLKRMNETYNEE